MPDKTDPVSAALATAEAIARLRAGSGNTDVLFLLASYDYFRAEVEQADKEIARLRAALAEMLESFTDPEDDNDILRRARAALGDAKAS
jgi:hypothetical protein